ncbi:tpr repeat-containing protein [Nannochloropsis gaditana]|uniref:Tpr repeat-containing protein n=1 Tax=Nannochloropsis gaditana TaxID=72520 RepID=W7T6A1_9STRA|nr:tpr repeat-containing protein [Nannochloropsis gaditana]
MPGATVRLVKLPALLFAIFFLLVAFIHVYASNIEEDVLEGKDISSMVAQGEELVNSRMFTEAKLGRAHAFTGNFKEAERLYSQALSSDPSFAPAHTSLGKLYLYQKETARALQAFEKALELSPGDGDALLGLARLEALQAHQAGGEERLHKAAALYAAAVRTSPADSYESAWFDYGVVLGRLGRHEEAAEKLERAVAMNEEQMNFNMLGQVGPVGGASLSA